MSPREHRDVHGHVDGVGLVETHAEVPLAAEQQQDEHADVHESDTGCRRAVKTRAVSGEKEEEQKEQEEHRGRDSHWSALASFR